MNSLSPSFLLLVGKFFTTCSLAIRLYSSERLSAVLIALTSAWASSGGTSNPALPTARGLPPTAVATGIHPQHRFATRVGKTFSARRLTVDPRGTHELEHFDLFHPPPDLHVRKALHGLYDIGTDADYD